MGMIASPASWAARAAARRGDPALPSVTRCVLLGGMLVVPVAMTNGSTSGVASMGRAVPFIVAARWRGVETPAGWLDWFVAGENGAELTAPLWSGATRTYGNE